MEVKENLAVLIDGIVKKYGSQVVLNHLHMKVPSGSIYSLLGASGCGKTTLLRCILGQLNIERGRIEVLGKTHGSAGLHIPGRDVGYMPQELALFEDFTMRETMYYYGILYRMKLKDIRSRQSFLTEFLELPTNNQLVGTLSGGQQRRFSLAVAMVHSPPLMILDEPTVGVDPILRAKIWEHLVELAKTSNTTIIITTHYIEEANQANLVGMMREGRLLAEETPADLIAAHHKNTLEDVFLQLSRVQDTEHSDEEIEMEALHERSRKEENDEEKLLYERQKTASTKRKLGKKQKSITEKKSFQKAKGVATTLKTSIQYVTRPSNFFPRPINVAALCWKELVRLYRRLVFVIINVFQPLFTYSLFITAVGKNVKGLKVVYANDDHLPANVSLSIMCDNSNIFNELEEYSNLGQLYVDGLRHHTSLDIEEYSNYDEARKKVKEGHAWAVIYIGTNFTVDLYNRICSISDCSANVFDNHPVTDNVINGSTIHIQYDLTDIQISNTIENETAHAYQVFYNQLIQLCSGLSQIQPSALPPQFDEGTPVYGKIDLSFNEYLAAGIIISLIYGVTISLTAVTLIVERNKGLVERTIVAGVNSSEVLIAIIFSQFLLLIMKVTVLLIFDIYVFKLYVARKSLYWLFGTIATLQGLGGLAVGLFLSSLCSTEIAALQSAIVFYFLPYYLSGILWPLQGIPHWLLKISYYFPSTLVIQALRMSMLRGWSLDHEAIWNGIVVSLAWFIGILLIAMAILNLRR